MQQFHYLKLKIGNKHRNCRLPCSILSTNEHMAKLTQRTLTHGYVDTNNSNYRMVNAPMRGEDSYLSCDNVFYHTLNDHSEHVLAYFVSLSNPVGIWPRLDIH